MEPSVISRAAMLWMDMFLSIKVFGNVRLVLTTVIKEEKYCKRDHISTTVLNMENIKSGFKRKSVDFCGRQI